MRVSPYTAASATAAFLITIIAGAGHAQTAMDAIKNKPGSVGLQPTQANSTSAATMPDSGEVRQERKTGQQNTISRSGNVSGNANAKNGGASGESGAAGVTGSSQPAQAVPGDTARRAGHDGADTSGHGAGKADSRKDSNSNGTQGRSNMTH